MSTTTTRISKVGVVGLGTMGAGIAQLSIEAGFDTVGREVSLDLTQRAQDRIAQGPVFRPVGVDRHDQAGAQLVGAPSAARLFEPRRD